MEINHKNKKIILPCFYWGPVSYYTAMTAADEVAVEMHEHFCKQTYRNRCRIATANGTLDLTVPTERTHQKQAMNDVKIKYDTPWQKQHWNAIESAYRNSPYFDFLRDELEKLYTTHETYLADLNIKINDLALKIMQIKKRIHLTTEYSATTSATDLRQAFNAKGAPANCTPYYQVFAHKFGFTSDLSILDLILEEGPESIKYLK